MSPMPRLYAIWVMVLLLPTYAGAASDGFGFDPVIACDFMVEDGLRTRGGYVQVGAKYECRSQRRNVIGGGPVNHTIRFTARGDAQRVTQLELQLEVNAQGAVQRTHRVLVSHAGTLFQRALGVGMTSEIETAILAGTAGQWRLNGRSVAVDRDPPGAQRYGLRLRIE